MSEVSKGEKIVTERSEGELGRETTLERDEGGGEWETSEGGRESRERRGR